MTRLTDFLARDDGAVAVDWVVLTAALCGVGMSAVLVLSGGVESLSEGIGQELADIEIVSFFSGSGSGPEEAGAPQEGADPEAPAPPPPQIEVGSATPWNGMKAGNYYGMGAVAAPGNTGVDRQLANQFAAADAPPGFNFDTPLYAPWSNSIVYTSDDGNFYSIDGVVYAVTDGTSYQQSQWTAPPIVAWDGR